jgi:hypothetical protein
VVPTTGEAKVSVNDKPLLDYLNAKNPGWLSGISLPGTMATSKAGIRACVALKGFMQGGLPEPTPATKPTKTQPKCANCKCVSYPDCEEPGCQPGESVCASCISPDGGHLKLDRRGRPLVYD